MMRWMIPWGLMMTLAPFALFGLWQVCQWGRLRRFMLWGALGLQVLFALTLSRGFSGLMVWLALLLALLWFMVIVTVPLAIIGAWRKRLRWPLWMRVLAVSGFCALTGFALFNAYMPKLRHVQLTVDKPLAQPLRLLLASDVHLYWLFGNRALDWLAHTAEHERVDMVVLPGDIINDRLDAFHARGMAPHLAAIRAPLGVYATMGNHEFYGTPLENAQALRDAGIIVLRDQALQVGDVIIAGRDDDHQRGRLSTAAILDGMDTNLPVILLDHRPTHMVENAGAGVDVQVSGHAHAGQIFPANYVVERMYDVHYGAGEVDGMAVVVTSGLGFWGVPLRLGSRSEAWIIDISGNSSDFLPR